LLAQTAKNPDHREGRELYLNYCVACHGMEGKGGEGASLTRKLKHGNDPQTLFRVIKHGVPKTLMPAHEIPDAEIHKLAAYVRHLNLESLEKKDSGGKN